MATKAKKSAAKKPIAKKPVAKKPVAKKPAAKKSVASRSAGGRLAMSFRNESTAPPKPKSNFCEDHDRLLRADRTCPISTCRFHKEPMP